MKTVFVLGAVCCIVCLASGQTITTQGPTSITIGEKMVLTCQPSTSGILVVNSIQLWKNTSTSAYRRVVSVDYDRDNSSSNLKWQNTTTETRDGVSATGSVNNLTDAQLRLTITQGNTVCTDGGSYKCSMTATLSEGGPGTAENETYVAVNTAPDDTDAMTVSPSVGGNGQTYMYSVGTVLSFLCTMTVGSDLLDVQWCYKQQHVNSFKGYPYSSHIDQGDSSIVFVECNYRRTSVLTYNVTSSDTSTQFMCEPNSGSLCGSSPGALRSTLIIKNNVDTGDTSGQGSGSASASAGVIAGAAIGGFAGILLIILVIYFLVIRRRSPGETYSTKDDGSAAGPAHTEGPIYSVSEKHRSRQGSPPGRPLSLPSEYASVGEVRQGLHYADLDIPSRPPGVPPPKFNRDPPTQYAAVIFV